MRQVATTGLCTVRYLTALPRRVLLMGQQVLSCVACRTSTEATSRRTEGLSKNPNQGDTAAPNHTAIHHQAQRLLGQSVEQGFSYGQKPAVQRRGIVFEPT